MTVDQAQIKASYPLPAYNYRVSIGSDTIGFSEVSGLNMEHEPVTYKHGLSFALGDKIIPGMRQHVRVTLKKGVVQRGHFLADWMQKVLSQPFQNHQKDILIDLCDETGKPVVRWKVLGALPLRLEAPAFSAQGNEVAIETLELEAVELQVDYHPG